MRAPKTHSPLLIAASLLHLASAAQAGPAVETVRVAGANLEVVLSDGEILTGRALAGAVLTIADAENRQIEIRIADAVIDPEYPESRRWLYQLEMRHGSAGEWADFCDEGPSGYRLGFPVEGRVTEDGSWEPAPGQLSFTCTGGALAKCIRFGYGPWGVSASGRPMADYYRACLRMVRADYCGDGQPHTRNGTLINIFDRIGIQRRDDVPGLVFEAAWGPNGAVCVAKTRIEAVWTLDQLRVQCRERLAGRIGEACSEAGAMSLADALIFNDSRDTRGLQSAP